MAAIRRTNRTHITHETDALDADAPPDAFYQQPNHGAHHKNLDTIGKQNYQAQGVEAELNFELFRVLPLYVLNNDMGIEALRFHP